MKKCSNCASDYLAIVERVPSASRRNTVTTFHVECLECNFCGPQPPEPQSRAGAVKEWESL